MLSFIIFLATAAISSVTASEYYILLLDMTAAF